MLAHLMQVDLSYHMRCWEDVAVGIDVVGRLFPSHHAG